MSFYLFLLIVISLSCGSAPAWTEVSSIAPIASLGIVGGWVMLCHVAARTISNQVHAQRLGVEEGVEYLEWQLSAFRWLALPVVVLTLCGFSLASWAEQAPVLRVSTALQSVILLSPGLAILAATWSAEHWFGVRMRFVPSGLRPWLHYLASCFRSGPAWIVLPTLLVMTASDVATWLPESWMDRIPGGASGLVIGLVALGFWTLPWWICRMIRTEPINEVTNQRLLAWLRSVGCHETGWHRLPFVRWNTDGRMINALVAGVFPRGRLLVLSDRILDELTPAELLLVVMHEIAHVKRFHVPLRMAAVVPGAMVGWAAGILLKALPSEALASWASVLSGIMGLIVTVLTLRMVAYFSEFDADRKACDLAMIAREAYENELRQVRDDSRSELDVGGGQETTFPEGESRPYVSAQKDATDRFWLPPSRSAAGEVLAAALTRVTMDHPASRRASWLHPSLAARVDRLTSIREPEESALVAGNPA